MDFSRLAATYGTPLYCYDFNYFTSRFTELRDAFSGRKSLLAYAVKANSNLSVIRHFARMGSGADCVSIGEVRRAIKAGVDPYKIIFSGVGKRDDELAEALGSGILFINVESEAEMMRLETIAGELGKEARISIRVNPNIDPKTHPYISTGLEENKFGVDLNSARRLYLHAHKSPHLRPVGVHFHIGSQLTELEPIREASAIVADLVRQLSAIDIQLNFFDVGGGIGVTYNDEATIAPYDYAQAILGTLKGLDVTIVTEPGRFLVANGGYFLTRVLYEKRNNEKRFVIVDGAMNDLIRPSLYKAYHKVEVVGKGSGGSPADIVGPVCESGDFLAKNVPLPATEHGDVLVVHSAGAYGFTMSSNYNTRPRPAEIAFQDDAVQIIRRRESVDGLLALEEECLDETA